MSSRVRSVLAATTVAALLAGCGGGGNGPTTPNSPNPTPTPAASSVRTVLLSGVGFVLNPDTVMFRNVDNPPVGQLDIRVDWPGSGDINLYVTTNACSSFADVRSSRCQILGKSDGVAKPEVVRFTTTANQTYTVWIHNNSQSRESGAFEVGITTNGPVTLPTPGTGDDPRSGLAPGPVSRVVVYIYQVRGADGNYRDKFQDTQGRWILHPGDFVVFDSTQLNALGEKCTWVDDPEYTLEDPSGVLSLRGSSQPFLFRTDVVKKGEITLRSSIDGIDSALLKAISE